MLKALLKEIFIYSFPFPCIVIIFHCSTVETEDQTEMCLCHAVEMVKGQLFVPWSNAIRTK